MVSSSTSSIPDLGKRPIVANRVTYPCLATVAIPIVDESSSDQAGERFEYIQVLPPSTRPVMVKVESQVVTRAVQGAHSPEYLATVRRRKARALCNAVERLSQDAARDDFAVCTYPVLKQVNELLTTLADASTEGNTREILRQLRNTLMNGGWNGYKDPAARATAVAILNHLAEAEDVLPKEADESFDRLSDVGLDPVGAKLFGGDEEDDTIDGENEVPG